jgi:hypothetical protein
MLSSMRVRCDEEEDNRQRMKLREAKKKAQRWLIEAKMKGNHQL